MKNNYLMWLVILVVVLGVGYAGYKYMKSSGGYGATPSQTLTYTTPTEATSPAASVVATGSEIVKTMTSATLGSYATDPKGMTLYTYSKDTAGVSNCTGNCATNWPPYLAASTGGTLPANMTLVKRADGTWQYAWAGKPLYFYISDKAAGDTTGEGIGGVWYVAKP